MRQTGLRCFALLALAACAPDPEVADVGVTRLSPGQSLDCAGFLLRAEPVRVVRRPAEAGWRLDVQVLTSPPLGHVTKGALVHDGSVLAWLPDRASEGIEDGAARSAVTPVLTACR